jgi:hypothetical protein
MVAVVQSLTLALPQRLMHTAEVDMHTLSRDSCTKIKRWTSRQENTGGAAGVVPVVKFRRKQTGPSTQR